MKIFVNNEAKEVKNQLTVLELLHVLKLEAARGMAVAVNNQVIPKLSWKNSGINENDRVTIIKATQGG